MSEITGFNINGENYELSSNAVMGSSSNVLVYNDNSSADLNIGDEDGNVLVQFKDGHIKTQNFDSSSTEKFEKTYMYMGRHIVLSQYSYDIDLYMYINNPDGGSIQGIDIYDGTLFSCHHGGHLYIYDFTNKTAEPIASLDFASAAGDNHANCLNLGNEVADRSPYPLLYLSNGQVGASTEWNCHVEKIIKNNNIYSAELVQTITLDISNFSNDGYQTIWGCPSWLFDKVRNKLWAFSAIKRTLVTTTGDPKTNKYIATCFNVPNIDEPNVILTSDDVQKQCIFEFDTYITQGGCIHDGIIYYSFGYGGTDTSSESTPARIRAYNTDDNSILARIELAGIMNSEPEDLAVYEGNLYLGINGTNLYKFTF